MEITEWVKLSIDFAKWLGVEWWEAILFVVCCSISYFVKRCLGPESRRAKKAFIKETLWTAIPIVFGVLLIWEVRTYQLRPKPFQAGVLGILLLKIEGDTFDKAQGQISRRLNEELDRNRSDRNWAVKPIPESTNENSGLLQTHEQVRQIGEQWKASLVIWGTRIGENELHLRVTVVLPSVAQTVGASTFDPVDMSSPAELIDSLMSTIDLIRGYGKYMQGDYRAAVAHFEAIFKGAGSNSNGRTDASIYAGNCYFQLAMKNKTEVTDLQKAIEYYQAALKEISTSSSSFDPALLAKQRSEVLNNLGTVYSRLADGNRLENLKRAIQYYEEALSVRNRDDRRREWAMTQVNLGLAYSNLPAGTMTDASTKAMESYNLALTELTIEKDKFRWAAIQNNLALLYLNMPDQTGEPVRKAAAHMLSVFKAYDGILPEPLLITVMNFGVVTLRLQTINPGQSSYAKQIVEEALMHVSKEKNAKQWAILQMSLGNVYRGMLEGDQNGNMRIAIKHYNAALEVQSESELPSDWASTQKNLGDAYAALEIGGRSENQKLALACYETAQRVHTLENFPDQWAKIQNGLGMLYSQLAYGDGRKNLQKALSYFRKTLSIVGLKGSDTWAIAQHGIGLAYSYLAATDGKEKDFQFSIQHFDHALSVFTRAAYPQVWALTQQNLGVVYSNWMHRDRVAHLQRAVEHFEQALTVWRLPVFSAKRQETEKLLAATRKKLQQLRPASRLARLSLMSEPLGHSCSMERQLQRASGSLQPHKLHFGTLLSSPSAAQSNEALSLQFPAKPGSSLQGSYIKVHL